MRRLVVLLAATALLAAACSSSDDAASSDGASPGETADPSPATAVEAAEECANDLRIVNADAQQDMVLQDRDLEPITIWADQGPHPDNTVDYDASLRLAISEVEILTDEQLGLGIPIGTPDNLAGDAYYLSLSFASEDGSVAAGQVYDDELDPEPGSRDGNLDFVLMNHGQDRLLPGAISVTITELTDDLVCGEIATVTKTDLQSFIGIEGTFAADRIQALEAAMG